MRHLTDGPRDITRLAFTGCGRGLVAAGSGIVVGWRPQVAATAVVLQVVVHEPAVGLATAPGVGAMVAAGRLVRRFVPLPNWWAEQPVAADLADPLASAFALVCGLDVVLVGVRHADPGQPVLTTHESLVRLGAVGWVVPLPAGRLFSGLGLLPDGERFVTDEFEVRMAGPSRHGLTVRRLADGAVVASADGPGSSTAGLGRLAVLPDGRVVTLAGSRLVVWTPGAGEPQLVSAPGRTNFRDLATHPGGRLLAAVRGSTVILFDTGSWRVVQELDPGAGRLAAVAAGPDGLLWAAAGDKGRAVVWDADG